MFATQTQTETVTPHPEDLLTPRQVAELVHHSAAIIYGWCARAIMERF